MTESSQALAGARERLMNAWKELHPLYKILGCVVFAWAAWRTVPILSAILHLCVLGIGLLFVLACIGASEETVALLNTYKDRVAEFMTATEAADVEVADADAQP